MEARPDKKDGDQEFRDLLFQLAREGWTQTDIADELGVHPSTVNSWFNREVAPAPYRASFFAEQFGFDEERVKRAIKNTRGD